MSHNIASMRKSITKDDQGRLRWRTFEQSKPRHVIDCSTPFNTSRTIRRCHSSMIAEINTKESMLIDVLV